MLTRGAARRPERRVNARASCFRDAAILCGGVEPRLRGGTVARPFLPDAAEPRCFAAFAARLRRRCLTHASTPRKRTFAACPWGRTADCGREIRLAGLRKGGGQFASPSPLVFAARLQKCLAPERFCLPFCPLPGVAACKPVVFFAAALCLSGGVVSPAEVARGTSPRRTGNGAGSVGFAFMNVPGRSRCSSSPGSFGWSSVPCSLPQRNWRALRGLSTLRRRRTREHQKRPERLAFRPCLMNGVHRQRCDRNFRSFAPSLRPQYLPARRDVGLTLRAWCAPRAEASLPEL